MVGPPLAIHPMLRRHALGRLLALPAGLWAGDAVCVDRPAAMLAVPGPRNSVSLPLELARAVGIDRELGLPLRLSFVGGGGVAIQELRRGNAEFAVFGLPALLRANLTASARLVALAAVDDLPLYTLVVRSDLRGSVRRINDLAGRTLGVHSNSLQVRTTSHQLADYLLRRHGVDPDRVKILAAGQSWETQSSMLASRSIDASMCDEPFATRLETAGLAVASAYPRQYSRDGRFSAAQIRETELFFRASNDDLAAVAALRIDDMVFDRWAGRKP